MTDFLKTNPYVTKDEYMWKWTIPQVKLSSFDFTHVETTRATDKKKKSDKNATRINSGEDLIADLGIPQEVFNKLKQNK